VSAEPLKRILVATDFSEGSERALIVATRLGNALGAAIDLVHIDASPTTSAISAVPGIVAVPAPEGNMTPRIFNVRAGIWSFISAFAWPHSPGQLGYTAIRGAAIVLVALLGTYDAGARYIRSAFFCSCSPSRFRPSHSASKRSPYLAQTT